LGGYGAFHHAGLLKTVVKVPKIIIFHVILLLDEVIKIVGGTIVSNRVAPH
jgi:hypothetical protein